FSVLRSPFRTQNGEPRTQNVLFLHTRATCSVFGSAQQYQGSFRYGTVARSRTGRTRAAIGRDALWWASALISSNTSGRRRDARTPTISEISSCNRSTRGSEWVHRYV